ncbi:hypothetical protein Pla110_28910 [Polystyrenella longa]|uniref:Uncharacterized protein n=1 Tax=Polystyrenella longa TaxID=2528007 RepID=A0A518CPN3_9PLAN|nr:hypothetical protein Pla110_28910 [Polystyrenella longa]
MVKYRDKGVSYREGMFPIPLYAGKFLSGNGKPVFKRVCSNSLVLSAMPPGWAVRQGTKQEDLQNLLTYSGKALFPIFGAVYLPVPMNEVKSIASNVIIGNTGGTGLSQSTSERRI